ncbi:MAG TPA: hypothetical protein VMS18_18975 [Candidatus Binatia bacterium]|nr:hypothetical protein [Candidatus Binatia bacterium]
MIEGNLHLDLLSNKGVRLIFSPHAKGTNSRPLGIGNTALLLADLESFWGFTPSKAKAAVAQVEKDGHAQFSVTVDEQAVNKLFL